MFRKSCCWSFNSYYDDSSQYLLFIVSKLVQVDSLITYVGWAQLLVLIIQTYMISGDVEGTVILQILHDCAFFDNLCSEIICWKQALISPSETMHLFHRRQVLIHTSCRSESSDISLVVLDNLTYSTIQLISHFVRSSAQRQTQIWNLTLPEYMRWQGIMLRIGSGCPVTRNTLRNSMSATL